MNTELKNEFESINKLFDIYSDGYICVYLIYRSNTAKPSNMELVSIFINHSEAEKVVDEWNKKINKCKKCPYCSEKLDDVLSEKELKIINTNASILKFLRVLIRVIFIHAELIKKKDFLNMNTHLFVILFHSIITICTSMKRKIQRCPMQEQLHTN